MSVKTQLPGYAGYIPAYQREFPTDKGVPAHKYEDVTTVHRGLMERTTYATNYNDQHGVKLSVAAPPKINLEAQNGPVPGPVKHYAEFDVSLRETREKRTKLEYETKPTCWQTTYNSQFDAWQKTDAAKAAADASGGSMAANLRARDEANLHRGPFSQNLLQGRDIATNYQRDFGMYGSNPLSRHDPSLGKEGLSKKATTGELFAGTNKGSVRIPNYNGFVPASHNNVNTVKGIPTNHKDNLLGIYRHDIPGYTGHQPTSVINDYGPRNPVGKTNLPSGLHAGLILDSMQGV